jgi:activator of 2-hydroxyglutaryl-CoA dehydratase/predicted nucleotide-binding protein (sugar kinase/HSP70/actin superfamily)
MSDHGSHESAPGAEDLATGAETELDSLADALAQAEARAPRFAGVKTVAVGIDIGSTTVKAVVCDPESLEILWSDYQRHETQQPEKVLEFLVRIGHDFPDAKDMRVFMTGSGSGPLCVPTGARFVQEVNAVTLAVEKLHPDVGSVIELGGQDAKIIMFRQVTDEDGEDTGDKNAITSMNDKCASGTGATIDKCMIKVGMPQDEVAKITFDPTKLHHVAAKCGVFAETDIVNLVKSGIPGTEIMNSLADAIVHQNLSVLTRGNTLHHNVLLLGGPNTYLPFLVECWRMRIPETWESRGYDYPKDRPIEELIYTPENAQYYAAFGAVVFGLAESADDETVGQYAGIDGLKNYIAHGRSASLAGSALGPLVTSEDELAQFREEYSIPHFDAATFTPGQTVRGVIGLDGGSTSSKAVLVDYETGEVLYKAYTLSKGNPIQDTKDILAQIKAYVLDQGAEFECMGFGATGYAANVLEESVKADVNIVETVAHMMSAVRYVPDADVICDIGGQDIKVLFLAENKDGGRDVRDFRLSNQCSAGNGMLLQAMADQFGVKLTEYAETAFRADLSPKFSYGCAVFLDADRVNFQKEGFTATQMLAGLAKVLPKNVWQYVVQVPRLAEFGEVFVLQGGTQRNLAAVKAQVDYIKERVPNGKVVVHPHCGEAGAIGAAMETLRVVKRRGHSTFIGLDQAIDLQYTTVNDESTVCHFCPNECSRTFIDTETPDGRTSRYISGFSCEKGTVESKEALKVLNRERNVLRKQFPNLVEEEAKLAFKHFFEPAPLPRAGSSKRDVSVVRRRFFRVARKVLNRGFQRSHADLSQVKIGMPRVMNLYSTAPFFRTFFESLGLPRQNLVWSPFTTEEMWAEGGRYGSIDPCYPSKVIQAHVHELVFHAHGDPKKRRGPLDYIYYPCITYVPSFVENVMDTASCPIVAGSPLVMKAAFTKEVDFFAREGIEYVDDAVTFTEPNLLKNKLFETWGERLGVTRDEVEWAVDQGFLAIDEFNRRMQERGRELIEQVERENRVAIIMIGRPYHNDPGLNHGIPEEFQVRGYPILSIRSIPKDKSWLRRYMGTLDNPLDLNDVWPENFSANSVQKVWGARFAAHHPNLAVLDLSSFKCGHDAPTYGLIDNIMKTARAPYSALHDLDANKPGGSIQIRVKTYTHKLKLVEEELRDQTAARAELARKVAIKRKEIMAQLAAKRSGEQPTFRISAK